MDAFEFEGGELIRGGSVQGLKLGDLLVLLGDNAVQIVAEFFEVRQTGFHAEEALFKGFVHGDRIGRGG